MVLPLFLDDVPDDEATSTTDDRTSTAMNRILYMDGNLAVQGNALNTDWCTLPSVKRHGLERRLAECAGDFCDKVAITTSEQTVAVRKRSLVTATSTSDSRQPFCGAHVRTNHEI